MNQFGFCAGCINTAHCKVCPQLDACVVKETPKTEKRRMAETMVKDLVMLEVVSLAAWYCLFKLIF